MRVWLDKVGHAIGVIEPERATPADILRCASQWADGRDRCAGELEAERARVVELTDELNRATKRYGELAELNGRNRKHADDADAEVLSLSAEVDALKGWAAEVQRRLDLPEHVSGADVFERIEWLRELRRERDRLVVVVDALERVIVRAVKG